LVGRRGKKVGRWTENQAEVGEIKEFCFGRFDSKRRLGVPDGRHYC
jgi:hypothetical protein